MQEYNHDYYGYIYVANHREVEEAKSGKENEIHKLAKDGNMVAAWTVIDKDFGWLYQGSYYECMDFANESLDRAYEIVLVGIEDLVWPEIEEIMCYESTKGWWQV